MDRPSSTAGSSDGLQERPQSSAPAAPRGASVPIAETGEAAARAKAPEVAAATTGRFRFVRLILAVLLAFAAGYGIWREAPLITRFLRGPEVAPGFVMSSGNIEAHQSVLSFTQIQAPIVYLPFDEGAKVEAGVVLARVDDRIYRDQLEIDRSNLAVATAQIAANQSALVAAEKSVASDEFDLSQKQQDYERAETLAQTHAGTILARDLALTAKRQSEAALARDQAMVDVAKHNLTLAKASEDAAAAKISLDQTILSYTELRAPFAGVISVRQAELGQLAAPGVAIFTLADLDHPWLRAYVNEPDLGKIRLGEPVKVMTDAYPGHVYDGRISFISPVAEFTPKTVETHAQRVTLVYRIRIDIDNPTHELLPGMPADALIKLLPPGK
jgi:HlyD family secretion protein